MATQRYSDEWLEVWEGDNRDALAQMPEQSVHAVITSPPYYGLRDYGLPKSVWGGDCDHEHDFDEAQACECGAWTGCLGLEPLPDCGRIFRILRTDVPDAERGSIRQRLQDAGLLDAVRGDTGHTGSARSQRRSGAGGVPPTTGDGGRAGDPRAPSTAGMSSRLDGEPRPDMLGTEGTGSHDSAPENDRPSSLGGPARSHDSRADGYQPAEPLRQSPADASRREVGPAAHLQSSASSRPDTAAQVLLDDPGVTPISSAAQTHSEMDSNSDFATFDGTSASRTERQAPDRADGTSRKSDRIAVAYYILPQDLLPYFEIELCGRCYVCHLVEVFRAVRRVLRDDGVLWLNLGDSYNAAGRTGHGTRVGYKQGTNRASANGHDKVRANAEGLKQKDLIGIPWMAAFALRADGWYLRADVVWNKPNAMPESVEDRPARSHESIFMLAKSARYFYDHLAVKEPASEATIKAVTARMKDPIEDREYQHDSGVRMGKRSPNRVWSDPEAMKRLLAGRNLRDVWNIPTVSYPGAHYATFPPKLVEPMLKASTSEGGVCATCGQPWLRETVDVGVTTAKGGEPHDTSYGRRMADNMDDLSGAGETGSGFAMAITETLGWATPCGHEGASVPATVLDPFGGSGTVAKVAQLFSRRAILIDLNAEYIDQQMVRNAQVSLGL